MTGDDVCDLAPGFISDTYRAAALLGAQSDIEVIEVEDYIANPKPNGYRSFHMIVEIPVHFSDRVEHVPAEAPATNAGSASNGETLKLQSAAVPDDARALDVDAHLAGTQPGQ